MYRHPDDIEGYPQDQFSDPQPVFDYQEPAIMPWILGACAVCLAVILFLFWPCAKAHASTIVDVAISELGHGEIGCDNCGPDVKRYTRGMEASWCAGFVSWVLREAGVDIPYKLSARQFWNMARNRVTTPQPGDIICFWRESPSSWKGHVGIVYKVGDGWITTIEGNVGAFPAKVKRITYYGVPKNLLGYVRVR